LCGGDDVPVCGTSSDGGGFFFTKWDRKLEIIMNCLSLPQLRRCPRGIRALGLIYYKKKKKKKKKKKEKGGSRINFTDAFY